MKEYVVSSPLRLLCSPNAPRSSIRLVADSQMYAITSWFFVVDICVAHGGNI